MGQVQSRYERPGGFWRRRKPQATTQEPAPEEFGKMPSPPRQPDQTSTQMDQSSNDPIMSPNTADTTPAAVAPFPNMDVDASTDTSDSMADKLGKVSIDKMDTQTSSPCDQPMTDAPDAPTKPDVLEKPDQPDVPIKSAEAIKAFGAAWGPPLSRPALRRESTPPHRIKIWSLEAWETERAYSNVHDHVTKTLNRIRQQQVDLNSHRQRQADRKMQLDIYNACDGCTLSIEYLVGHFSTKFFHYNGPENIMSMLATIEADALKLDDLRQSQLTLRNYGYNLEKKLIQTEGHIRELAELAKRIKEMPAEAEEDEDMDVDTERYRPRARLEG